MLTNHAQKRITTAGSALALAIAGLGIGAVPAQAAPVTGTIINVSTFTPMWISVSKDWPSTGTIRINPKQGAKCKAFISGWNLYSPWGYRYDAGVWHLMNTTGQLPLYARPNGT